MVDRNRWMGDADAAAELRFDPGERADPIERPVKGHDDPVFPFGDGREQDINERQRHVGAIEIESAELQRLGAQPDAGHVNQLAEVVPDLRSRRVLKVLGGENLNRFYENRLAERNGGRALR